MKHVEPRSDGSDFRLPPQNLEAEQKVLGSILFDNGVLGDIIPLLSKDDFYSDTHQAIFVAIRDLYDLGKPIDLMSLSNELRRRNQIQAVGGEEALARLVGSVPHAADVMQHAQIVRQKSILRDLVEHANQTLRACYSKDLTAERLLEDAERRLFRIAEDNGKAGKPVEHKEIVTDTMAQICLRSESRSPTSGLSTGFLDLDEITTGLRPGQLIVVASRPSMGKTAFALNICEHVVTTETPALFVTLELDRREVSERLLTSSSRLDGYKVRSGAQLGTRELLLLGKAFDELRGAPLFIDDTRPTMGQLRSSARRLKRQENLGLIVVDPIQLLESGNDETMGSWDRSAHTAHELKRMAHELNVPVIALSAVNRDVDKREDRFPRLGDLRDSGPLEDVADIVILIHRPEYYDSYDQPGIALLHLAKHRNGPIGVVKLAFSKHMTHFENLASVAEAASR